MTSFIKGDGSTHNIEIQETCMRSAAWEGFKSSMVALGVSTVTVLGACQAFPGFNKRLSVSSKTALIASPFFATFVLMGELELNACAKRYRELMLSEQRRGRRDGGSEVVVLPSGKVVHRQG